MDDKLGPPSALENFQLSQVQRADANPESQHETAKVDTSDEMEQKDAYSIEAPHRQDVFLGDLYVDDDNVGPFKNGRFTNRSSVQTSAAQQRFRQGSLANLREKVYAFISNHVNFYRLHFVYIVFFGLVGSTLIYAFERNRIQISFVNALFTGFSAITLTGLIVEDTSKLSSASVGIIACLFQLGSTVFLSIFPILVRMFYFRKFNGAKYYKSIAMSDKKTANISRPKGSKNLSEQDKMNLQYSSLYILLWIIISYILIFYLLGYLSFELYLRYNRNANNILKSNTRFSVTTFAIFHTLSSFNNAGFVLFSQNLIPFQRDPFILLLTGSLILLGFTCYPIALRYYIKILAKFFYRRNDHETYEILCHILKHPRALYTHLFPDFNTHLLGLIVLTFLISEWVLFMALDWKVIFFNGQPTWNRVLSSLFQSISTRFAGFNVFDLSLESVSMQLLHLVLMYISGIPAVVTIRTSAIVEKIEVVDFPEKKHSMKLGEYHLERSSFLNGSFDSFQTRGDSAEISPIWKQIWKWLRNRNFLLRQVTILFLLLVCISIIEDDRFRIDPLDFTLTRLMYEVSSAYGCTGLSLGYSNTPTSFSAQLSSLSKILVIIICILGRHRGLPTSLDAAVRLVLSKSLHENLPVELSPRTLAHKKLDDNFDDEKLNSSVTEDPNDDSIRNSTSQDLSSMNDEANPRHSSVTLGVRREAQSSPNLNIQQLIRTFERYDSEGQLVRIRREFSKTNSKSSV